MNVQPDNIMQVVSNPKNWKKTHKKSYEVYVCRPLPGSQCTNILEGTQYVTDKNKQFIISGTVGETWVIDINKLAKTYTFSDDTPITPDTLKSKCTKDGQMDWQKMRTRADANINWAILIPKSIQNFPVQTSWGDTLLANRPGIKHGLGDFLVCADNGCGQPNLNDMWVVNGEVFPTTYDLHAFPNMFPESVTQAKTVVPKMSFVSLEKSSNTVNANNETDKFIDKFISIAQKVARTLASTYAGARNINITNFVVTNKKRGLDGNRHVDRDYNYWRYEFNIEYSDSSTTKIKVTAMTVSSEEDKDPYIAIEINDGEKTIPLVHLYNDMAPREALGKKLSTISNDDFAVMVKKMLGTYIDKEEQREAIAKANKKFGGLGSLMNIFKR